MKTNRILSLFMVLLASQVSFAGTAYRHDLTPSNAGWHMIVDLGMRQTMESRMAVAGTPSTGYKTYFSATDNSGEIGLWCTDGVNTAWRVMNSAGYPKNETMRWMTGINDKVVFTCNGWLYVSDGTSAGTFIMDNGGTIYGDVVGITQLNSTQFIFMGRRYKNGGWVDSKMKLFVSNGTPSGTSIVSEDIEPRFQYYTNVLDLNATTMRVGNKVYFEAWGGINWDLFVTDGTAAGTKNITNYTFTSHDPLHHNFVNFNDQALCYVVNFGSYWALAKTVNNDATWVSFWADATATADLYSFRNVQCYNGQIYFTAFGHLWRHDGSNNYEVSSSLLYPDLIGKYKDNLMFVAQDNGTCSLFTCDKSNNVTKLSNFGVTFQDNGFAIVNDWFYTYGECMGRGWGIYGINALNNPTPTQVINQLAWHPITDGMGYKMIDSKGRLVYAMNTTGANGTKLYSYEYTDKNMFLDENQDNSTKLSNNAAQLVNAQIERQMYANSGYYTICLPFDLTHQQLQATFGDSYDLEAFTSTSESNEKLQLNFTQVNKLTHGVPYLIKPSKNVDYSPTIPNCWVYNTAPQTVEKNGVKFIGTYNPKSFTVDAKTLIRLLGANNTIYRPNSTTAMNGLRGYFEIGDDVSAVYVSIRNGDGSVTEIPLVEETPSAPSAQKIMQDGQVRIIRNGERYDLLGRKIQ